MHVFGLQVEEAGVVGGNPRGHRENMQTSHRKGPALKSNPDLLAAQKDIVDPKNWLIGQLGCSALVIICSWAS